MTAATLSQSPERTDQQRAAKLAGAIYLVAMALSIWTELGIRGALYVRDDAAATAANILAHEGLFRLGIVVDVAVYLSSLVLAWAFFRLLAPFDRIGALLGVWLRLVEVALCMVAATFSAIAVGLLGGAPQLAAFEPAQLNALVRIALTAHGQALTLGFVFLGFGSTVFATLLWRSRYVPRALAGLGIVASLILALFPLLSLAAPGLRPYFMIVTSPMFFYEVGLGLWFLIKGVDLDAR
jgi:hypothetical protein